MNNLIGLSKGQSALIDNDPWELAEEQQHRKESGNLGHWILPLADWLEHCQQTDTCRGSQTQIGVLLDPEDDPEILAERIDQIPLIALQFHTFAMVGPILRLSCFVHGWGLRAICARLAKS